MKIKLTKRYSTYRPNTVVECDEAVALRLIREGVAVREQQADLIETASVEPIAETADATPRRRTRHQQQREL
jgi:hypothetical protein